MFLILFWWNENMVLLDRFCKQKQKSSWTVHFYVLTKSFWLKTCPIAPYLKTLVLLRAFTSRFLITWKLKLLLKQYCALKSFPRIRPPFSIGSSQKYLKFIVVLFFDLKNEFSHHRRTFIIVVLPPKTPRYTVSGVETPNLTFLWILMRCY